MTTPPLPDWAMASLCPPPRAHPPQGQRVVVAMSGGVDSSVAAAVLKAQGYEVVGITLQLYDHGAAIQKKGACCAGQDIQDARMVADRLGIPHYVLNYESRFSESVMERFADSYLAGETPIPCVQCNQSVKFRDLLATAQELGAAFMATGHYVERRDGPFGAELHRGAELSKDQSYFLFATTQAQLDYLYFPLGRMEKPDTRRLAEHFGLPVSDKPDSQDICFVPGGNYAKVVERLRPGAIDPGEIVHVDGRVLGRHEGIIHFTVGQRKGLGVAEGTPLYVVKLDAATHRVIVGPESALHQHTIHLRDLNWLHETPLTEAGVPVTVKIRSAHPGAKGHLFPRAGQTAEIVLEQAEAAIAPGQACVAYDGSRVMGGGWIVRQP